MAQGRLIGFASVGMYNPESWIEEGDGLLVSARSIRATWLRKCRTYDAAVFHGLKARRYLNEVKGHPRASLLLLAYAAEMYLKAGVVRVFTNCREEPVGKWLKKKIGHNYKFAAEFVELELSGRDRDLLEFLTNLVTEMRYPVVPRTNKDKWGFPSDTDHTRQINERNARIWSQTDFQELCSFVKRIAAHVQRIEWDEDNSASFRTGKFGEEGYWVFRLGGNLSPRVSYGLCPKTPAIDGAAVRRLVEADVVFRHYTSWANCKVLVDDDDPKGFRTERPNKTEVDK